MDPSTLTGLILLLSVTIFVFVAFYYCYEDPLVPGGVSLITPAPIKTEALAIQSIPDPGYEMQSPGPKHSLLPGDSYCNKIIKIVHDESKVDKDSKRATIVCTHEPYMSQSKQLRQGNILYLNAFTGIIYKNASLYGPNGPPLNADELVAKALLNKSNSPNIAYFGTYRDEVYTRQFTDLRERQELALEGKKLGKVQIFGNGWPFKVEHNSRNENQQSRYRKQLYILRNRFAYSICSENSIAPNYITEKIWAAIEGGTVPIYKGGNGIEKYFAENSFIDTRKFENANALFQFIENMTANEYERRLRACINAFNNNRNNYKNEAQETKLRIKAEADKFCNEFTKQP